MSERAALFDARSCNHAGHSISCLECITWFWWTLQTIYGRVGTNPWNP